MSYYATFRTPGSNVIYVAFNKSLSERQAYECVQQYQNDLCEVIIGKRSRYAMDTERRLSQQWSASMPRKKLNAPPVSPERTKPMNEDRPYGLDYALDAQKWINSASAWLFDDATGRALIGFIRSGQCCLGHQSRRDYWGLIIPSRDEVKPGTHGSLDFVRKQMGNEWADAIAAVE